MKAKQLSITGQYWCSRNLEAWDYAQREFPTAWSVVAFKEGKIFSPWEGEETMAVEVPDYVDFFGPIAPPGSNDTAIDRIIAADFERCPICWADNGLWEVMEPELKREQLGDLLDVASGYTAK